LANSSTEAARKREARDRNKDYVRDIKERSPCADCGKTYHYSQMDFDHIQGKKKHNLARYANSAVSIKTIKDELKSVKLFVLTVIDIAPGYALKLLSVYLFRRYYV